MQKEDAMRMQDARGVVPVLMVASLATAGWCQDPRTPSLLPAWGSAGVAPATAVGDSQWYGGDISPVPPVQYTQTGSVGSGVSGLADQYDAAMKGGYEGVCTTCSSGSCRNHYVYASGLAMTHVKQGGFVAGVDSTTFDAELFFCQREFNNLWKGGFELGTGWCFGSDNRAGIELVYWGLYPGTDSALVRGNLDSTIDFGDLDYNGINANTFVTAADVMEVQWRYAFHSAEINLFGNGACGGPLGCGMTGCCLGNSGSPWGFGWVGGFRYIHLNEAFLFRADTTDAVFNGDPTELNYRMQLNNNLFGFQLGGGISYCVTQRLTTYAIAKFGVYDNRVSQFQTVYGTQGTATVNNGPNTNVPFIVRSTDDVLAGAGQFDLGGRWAVNDRWSVNFGYRVMALAGVAISETNAVRSGFQNLEGIASQQTTGSFILHGGYLGATYAW
jgi:hypothetical protein